MAITAENLAKLRPCLYHMAAEDNWLSIRSHGLLSTSALLDLFGVRGSKRERLERRHRPKSVTICHPKHGRAVIRDQKPMSDEALRKALPKGMKPSEWYRILNKKVFFWLDEERLEGMLDAHKTGPHTVLIFNTKNLLEAHKYGAFLSSMNSGYTKRKPAHRDRNTFCQLGDDSTEHMKRGKIVELSAQHLV